MTTSTKTYSRWRIQYVQEITGRALNEELVPNRRDFVMSLQAADCHLGINLKALVDAPKFVFSHDVLGIANNLNRKTARIENCFLPICTTANRPRNLPDYPSWFTPLSEPEEPIR